MVNVVKLKLNHLPGKKLSSVDIVMVTVKERMTSELKPKHCVFGAFYSPCVFDSRWQERLLDMLCWPLFLVPLLSNMVLCSLMLVSHQILLTLGWFNCVRIPKHFQVFDAVSPIPEQMDNTEMCQRPYFHTLGAT